MKQTFLLLSAVFALSACSGDDSNSSTKNSKSFHPPAWVQGTWTYNAGGQIMGLKFTKDDLCTISNTTAVCNKETLALYDDKNAKVQVDEDISDTDYSVDITITSLTTNYHVQKVSSTQINWVLNSSSTLTLTKQ